MRPILSSLLALLILSACAGQPVPLDTREKFISAVEGRTLVLTGGNRENFTRDGQVRVTRPDGSLFLSGEWAYKSGQLCTNLTAVETDVALCLTPARSRNRIVVEEFGGNYALVLPRSPSQQPVYDVLPNYATPPG